MDNEINVNIDEQELDMLYDDDRDDTASPQLDRGQVLLDDILQEGSSDSRKDEDISDDEFLDSIIKDAAVSEGPSLPKKIKLLTETLSMKKYSSHAGNKEARDMADKLKGIQTPENCKFLQLTMVNPAMFPLISGMSRKVNGEALKVEASLTKIATINAQGIDKLTNLKRKIPGHASENNEVIQSLAQGIEISGFGRYKLNEVRREVIVSGLNPEYKHLTETSAPGKGLLFGEDLADSMKEVETTNRLSAKLRVPSNSTNNTSSSFLGKGRSPQNRYRGRGRYRGQRGQKRQYNSQYNNGQYNNGQYNNNQR